MATPATPEVLYHLLGVRQVVEQPELFFGQQCAVEPLVGCAASSARLSRHTRPLRERRVHSGRPRSGDRTAATWLPVRDRNRLARLPDPPPRCETGD
jgi:hypothetical protein